MAACVAGITIVSYVQQTSFLALISGQFWRVAAGIVVGKASCCDAEGREEHRCALTRTFGQEPESDFARENLARATLWLSEEFEPSLPNAKPILLRSFSAYLGNKR